MKNLNNVLELMEELKGNIGEYGEEFTNYSDGYICDLIDDIADSSVNIYNHDLWEWAKNNEEYVEQAIEYGFYNVHHEDFNLMRLFMAGQYLQIQEELYEHLDESIKYWIYEQLEQEYISDEIVEFIEKLCTNVDNNELLENILEEVNNYIEEIEGENDNE